MDWDWESDEDETYTAYHEAGHAIVGCALGAQIDRVSLSQASAYDDLEDDLPNRFGDCLVNWGRVDPNQVWQQQRELLTILAGPIAEWVYRAEDADEIDVATWHLDWQQAEQCVRQMHAQREMQNRIMRDAISRLKRLIANPPVWPAIAALADELSIGDAIDGERVAELVRFWWRRSGY
ncbi:cell division protein FtsH [Rhodopirellula sp. SWK7]|uniref:cell division protein FtsH n=1 Tax=Rhodopirellula sp. SWK7 TaxID=595460 RepID=UPI0005C71488|nr:cell division protein FtsH [Rhodopirellula sp. SWK7]